MSTRLRLGPVVPMDEEIVPQLYSHLEEESDVRFHGGVFVHGTLG